LTCAHALLPAALAFTLIYKGISKKADLLRTLRESGSQKDIADPIAKWQTAPTRSLQMAESKDNADAAEHF